MTTLETRIISGKGVLRVPQNDDLKKAKILTLHVDVIRPPLSGYLNVSYSPPRSRYATLNFTRDGYVVQQLAMEYDNQMWEWFPDLAFQVGYAVECAYQGTLESIRNLGISLGSPPISFTNNIKDWRHSRLWFDSILVKCYAETAIRLVLSSKAYDVCPEQDPTTAPPPPPPPPPPPNYPPGTKLADTETPASPPYTGADDGGLTVPFPDDEAPPEGGDTGGTTISRVYSLTYTVKQFPGGSVLTRAGIWILGEVGDVRFKSPTDKTVQVWCRGRVPNRFDPPPPQPLAWVDIPPPEAPTAVELHKVGVVDVTP